MTLRWHPLRQEYPRIVTGMLLGIAALLLLTLVLVFKRAQYGLEFARMRTAMTDTERRRIDALASSEENRLAIAVELARRDALGDQDLHLAVDIERGLLFLERQGARLREMRVELGPEATVGTPPDVVFLARPLGKRMVARLVDGSYRWAVPDWIYLDRGQSVPDDRRLAGALGSRAVFLDCGALLYARPTLGPLSEPDFVLPGSVRMEAADIDAILADVHPGMAVYFH